MVRMIGEKRYGGHDDYGKKGGIRKEEDIIILKTQISFLVIQTARVVPRRGSGSRIK